MPPGDPGGAASGNHDAPALSSGLPRRDLVLLPLVSLLTLLLRHLRLLLRHLVLRHHVRSQKRIRLLRLFALWLPIRVHGRRGLLWLLRWLLRLILLLRWLLLLLHLQLLHQLKEFHSLLIFNLPVVIRFGMGVIGVW